MVLGLSFVILGMEVVGGIAAGSLALLSDAGHVFGDILATTSAIVIERAVRRGRSERRWRSWGGYLNATLLFLIAASIVFEAIARIDCPVEVKSGMMIVVATIGAGGNFLQHRILNSSAARHVTHRGMRFHVLSDLWQSIAVVATGIVIAATGLAVFDLIVSFVIAIVFTLWSAKLLWESAVTGAGGTP